MAVKTEKELSESLRALWLKAVSAIELRNFGYAISLIQKFLSRNPSFSQAVNFCDVRKSRKPSLLRKVFSASQPRPSA